MTYVLFFILVAFALLGDARIFLFVLNRLVFGSHRHEQSPWTFLIWVTPPALLALTLLFWPLHGWVDKFVTPWPVLSMVGAGWLFFAAAIGVGWIVRRLHLLLEGEPPIEGVRTQPPRVIRLRKAHIPFAWVRRLGGHNDLYDLEVTRHEIFIDDLPPQFDGYRIAFITDTHVASFVRRGFYREIHAQLDAFDPDLILLGGDFVSFNRHIKLMAEALIADLRARDGVYAILGNHDYWAGADEVKEAMGAHGVQFIINQNVTLTRDGATLPLLGIDELYRGEPDVDAAFAGVSGPTLGVSHHPDIIDLLDGRRLDLLVCGHTHGGQIRFPFFGAVVVPSRHEGRYASGFHRVGRVLMYVSRGIGAIPPLRILCRPELATFVLRRSLR
ncbi:MAG TPA: metallophosphoesterase [Thermoanaerobaculia bacterium]